MDGWVAMGWDGFGWDGMGWGRLDHSKPNAVATHEYRHRSALRCYFNDYADEQRWPAMATRAMIHQSSGHGNAICVIYADAQRTQPDTQILSECVCVFVCLRLARRSGRYKMFGYRRCRAQTTCLPLSGSTWMRSPLLIYDFNNTEIKSLSGLAFLGCCLGLTCSKCCHR